MELSNPGSSGHFGVLGSAAASLELFQVWSLQTPLSDPSALKHSES